MDKSKPGAWLALKMGPVLAAGLLLAACRARTPAFSDVTSEAGLGDSRGVQKTRAAPPGGMPVGGALLLFDANKDGRLDLYVVRASTRQEDSSNLLFLNKGDGTFQDATRTAGVGDAGFGLAAAAADYDNDGNVDFYVTNWGGGVLYHNNGDGTFTDVTRKAGLGGRRFALNAVFADFGCSGALDIFVPTAMDVRSQPRIGSIDFHKANPARNLLYKSNGNGTFKETAAQVGIADPGVHGSAFVSDFDHDRDVDILAAGPDGPMKVYRNDRQQGFREDSAAHGLDRVAGTWSLVAEDFTGDRFEDVFALSTGCAPNRLFVRSGYRPYEEFLPPRTYLGRGGTGAAAFDFDNDGSMDLLISGSCESRSGGFLLLRNRGDGTFEDATQLLPIPEPEQDTSGNFALGDYDGDGDVDIFLVRDGGRVALLRNNLGKKNHWLDVALSGSQGSSKDGFGAKVEVKAGDLWIQRELTGLNGGSSQSPGPLHFGLGKHSKVELVRVTWPTGIRQSLNDAPADRAVRITEKGQKSSCPFLFAWDGTRYRFVSDLLGAGFIGILTGPETYYQPRSDEYLRLESGLLRSRNGKYLLSIAERLEEVDYLDQVKLLAVDHAAGVEVHPNERLPVKAPFPLPQVIAVRDARPPVSATDDRSSDILPRLAARDRLFVESFELLPHEGYTKRHSITLDLGDVGRHGAPAILLLSGYLRYWTSNSAFLASQNGLSLEPSSVEVKNRNGAWVRVIDDMGSPAGLPKTIVADLTDKFLSDDRTIRITTNMEVYWDQIRVASQVARPSELRVTELAPEKADLAWLGYPKMTTPDGRPPFEYDYEDLDSSVSWRRQEGFYTGYGDVTRLITRKDDEFVIMGHGERLLLSFDAGRLPDLPPGWERDFFVYVNGFVKEMNPHTAYLSTVEPLPFQRMSNYPYPKGERYPDDPEHAAYRKRYNRRWVRGSPD